MLKKLKGYMLYMIARSVVTGKSFVRGALHVVEFVDQLKQTLIEMITDVHECPCQTQFPYNYKKV